VGQDYAKGVPQVISDSDAESCGYHDSSELSPLSKLSAGLVSLAPVKVPADGSGIIGLIDSAMSEVRVNTEVKSDSAGSDIV